MSTLTANRGDFFQSLAIQMRVIGALVMRELITRYSRHNIGFLWVFVEPMLFTVGVVLLWTFFHNAHTLKLPLIPFVLTGYSSVLLWRNTIGRCGNALEPNRALLHHRNVRVIDFYIARLLLEISGTTVSFFVLTSALTFVGLMKAPYDMFETVLAWFMMSWFAVSMGLLVGAGAALSESVERVWHVTAYLFMPLSGAFFMVDWLPYRIQKAALYVPTINGTELFREGFFGPSVHAHYDLAYMAVFNLVLLTLGLWAIKRVSTRVEGA